MDYQATSPLSLAQALRRALTKSSRGGRRRVRRSEYWWCMLAIAIYYALLGALYIFLEDVAGVNTTSWWCTALRLILGAMPVGLWVMENYGRLHDTGHRDTWLMGVLIPLALLAFGSLLPHLSMGRFPNLLHLPLIAIPLIVVAAVFATVCLVFCLRDSDKVVNAYGPSPKYRSVEYEE